MQNALNVLVNRNTNPDININSVLIIGPAWLNDDDKASGSANPTDIVFHGSQWNHGGNSRFPLLEHKLTSYEVLDYFLDWVFDNATFPNMKNAVVMGHSMGAQATQRYALLKKSRWYDDNVKFWIGNPGSYAWPVDSRPNTNASCTTGNEWHVSRFYFFQPLLARVITDCSTLHRSVRPPRESDADQQVCAR